jgi:AcrR family transcriptional regulator
MPVNAPLHPGRPRSAELNQAILQSALEVMIERGYHGTTLSEIARRARVGTPAIYRRWPTKAAMALDLFIREQGEEPIPDSGSIRDDLVEFMRFRLRTWRTPLFHQVVLPLLLESLAQPAVEDTLRSRFLLYRKPLESRILRAIRAGELRADLAPDRLLDLLMGTIAMPLLFSQPLPVEADAEPIVDQLLNGLGVTATSDAPGGQDGGELMPN